MNFSNVKPFQIILLGIFVGFAIIGLIVFSNFGGFGGSTASVGKVTIWGTLPQASMQTVINNLQLGNQDFVNVSYVQKQPTTFSRDLADAIASGAGPELVLISQEELLGEQTKLQVIPYSTISERDYIDTYLPIAQLFMAQEGVYGIPLVVDPMVLYYNRTLVTSAGIALPPTTWEAVSGYTPQLTRAAAGVVSQSAIPFGFYANVENARAIVSLLLLQAGTPITSVGVNGAQSALLTSSRASDASPAASALTFYTQFSDPIKTVYTWNRAQPSARQGFLAGTLALYPGFASELPQLQAANPNLPFDMAPIPQPQNAQTRVNYGRVYAFAVPKASLNPSGAVSVAFALANSSRAAATAAGLTMAPATRESLTPAENDRYQPIYFQQALIAQGWLSPSPSVTDSIFNTMITNITSGSVSVGQALETANQAIDAAI